jgi:hypothetical protein
MREDCGRRKDTNTDSFPMPNNEPATLDNCIATARLREKRKIDGQAGLFCPVFHVKNPIGEGIHCHDD